MSLSELKKKSKKELKENKLKSKKGLDSKTLSDLFLEFMLEDSKDFRLAKFKEGWEKEHDEVFLDLINELAKKLSERLSDE